MNPQSKKLFALVFGVLLLFTLCACSIHEQKEEGGNKKVDIKVPFVDIHVGTDTDAKDTGLSAYPGARPKEDSDSDKHRANISIGGDDFGLKVVAASFTTDDPPEKVIDFYRKDLKKYGNVLECPKGISENKHHGDDDGELKCSNDGKEEPGKLDLAVGIPEKQRIVSVKPNGKGSEFALVYVQVQGKKETL
jgi:hypothetical protein